VSCDKSAYPSLYFKLNGDHWVEMHPDTYIMRDVIYRPEYCILALSVNTKDFFFFGDSFLRSYYQIYDDENGLIGLTPHLYSKVGAIKFDNKQPENINYAFLDEVMITFVGFVVNLVSLVMLSMFGYIVYELFRDIYGAGQHDMDNT